ncbi:hypothetical protein SUGI_0134580 [Cryptomeria japonica]|nr:hypothetical protein SUGI_0134580 [Cryptomeria japonica]
MATFFGLMSSRGFLWLQLAIFIWQAIRPAATMRVPWALFSTAVYKIFRGKKFDNEHFILLSTDHNETADSDLFCKSYYKDKNPLTQDFTETSLVKRLTQLPFDNIDTTRGEFHFKTKAFRVEITKEPSNNELVKFKLELKEVLYDLVKASFTMTQDSFKSYIGCWKLLEEGSAGLVRAVEKADYRKEMWVVAETKQQ